uniref:CASPASE_P10 domain-containing protein n=1 Tax=Mesocestoides corti TaxID=53468 RepID=A0A5K3FKR0_MESCO
SRTYTHPPLKFPNDSVFLLHSLTSSYVSVCGSDLDSPKAILTTNIVPTPSPNFSCPSPWLVFFVVFPKINPEGFKGVATDQGADILDYLASANPLFICVLMACEEGKQPTREGHD